MERRWICDDCGYVHEDEEAPDDCHACGALRESFQQDSRQLLNE